MALANIGACLAVTGRRIFSLKQERRLQHGVPFRTAAAKFCVSCQAVALEMGQVVRPCHQGFGVPESLAPMIGLICFFVSMDGLSQGRCGRRILAHKQSWRAFHTADTQTTVEILRDGGMFVPIGSQAPHQSITTEFSSAMATPRGIRIHQPEFLRSRKSTLGR